MTKRIQLFEFWAIHSEREDSKGNLVVTGLLGPHDKQTTTALFEPGQTSPKGSWHGRIIEGKS